MFGKVFGRRNSPQTAVNQERSFVVPPDVDGVRRAIPKSMGDGEHGNFLRQAGFSPDDASNVMPTQDSLSAQADDLHRQLEARVVEINAQLPDNVSVAPWAMLPWSIWSGPNAGFLMVAMKMFPCSPLNTFILVDDDRSAAVLGLPVHPRGVPQGFGDAINRLLGELREEYGQAFAEIERRMQQGDFSALDTHEAMNTEAMKKVIALARFMTQDLFGEEAFNRSRQIFGEAIGW